MKNYEEELIKGCGEKWNIENPLDKDLDMDIICGEKGLYCPECKAKLEGFQKAKELFKKMVESWGTHKCGWGDDACDYIDKEELLKKLNALGGKEE